MSEQTSQVSGLIEKLTERQNMMREYALKSKAAGALILGSNVGFFALNTPSILSNIVQDKVSFFDGFMLASSTVGAIAGVYLLRTGSDYHDQANIARESLDRAELAQAQAQDQIAAYEQFK